VVLICSYDLVLCGGGGDAADYPALGAPRATLGGDYLFRLTVTSDRGAMKSVFEKTIKIIDDGVRPTADFSWLPERIVAGEEVAFTDQSKAAEGSEIVKREWTFGAILSTEENPKITFGSHGKINVSLTVTDNKKRKDTKTVTMDVQNSGLPLMGKNM